MYLNSKSLREREAVQHELRARALEEAATAVEAAGRRGQDPLESLRRMATAARSRAQAVRA